MPWLTERYRPTSRTGESSQLMGRIGVAIGSMITAAHTSVLAFEMVTNPLSSQTERFEMIYVGLSTLALGHISAHILPQRFDTYFSPHSEQQFDF